MPSGARKTIKSGLSAGCTFIFGYETQKIVRISSVKVGIINRIMQIVIISYIIGWVMIYKKGYQDTDQVVSAIVTKVKGVSFTNESNGDQRIWDVADYVVPPQEKDAVFITTNAIITRQQTQSTCPEDPTVPGAACKLDSDCLAYDPIMLGNGVKTGRCVDTEFPENKTKTKSCEIYAWCPVETETSSSVPLLRNVEDFTLFIKNSVEFRKFHIMRSNVIDSSRLSTCRYDPVKDPDCPVMTISTILNQAQSPYNIIGVEGGVIGININWQCNFDLDVNLCKPNYTFHRLDDQKTKFASGWNFRHANYYQENGTEYRTLVKAYGIRLIIYVTGQAGKFNMIPFTMNLGSGLALLGIATLLCDMVVLYCLNRKEVYRDAKYETIVEEDAFKLLEESTNGDQPISDHQSTSRDRLFQANDEEESLSNRHQVNRSNQ